MCLLCYRQDCGMIQEPKFETVERSLSHRLECNLFGLKSFVLRSAEVSEVEQSVVIDFVLTNTLDVYDYL